MRSSTATEICAVSTDPPSARPTVLPAGNIAIGLYFTRLFRGQTPRHRYNSTQSLSRRTLTIMTPSVPDEGARCRRDVPGGPVRPRAGKRQVWVDVDQNFHIDMPFLVTPTSTERPCGRRCRRYVPGVHARVQTCLTNSNGDQTVRGPSISNRREIVPKNTSEQIAVSSPSAERTGVFGRNLRKRSATIRGTR